MGLHKPNALLKAVRQEPIFVDFDFSRNGVNVEVAKKQQFFGANLNAMHVTKVLERGSNLTKEHHEGNAGLGKT